MWMDLIMPPITIFLVSFLVYCISSKHKVINVLHSHHHKSLFLFDFKVIRVEFQVFDSHLFHHELIF